MLHANHTVDTQIVRRVLWPPQSAVHPSVWAVLDFARDPRIETILRESGLDFSCLYSEHTPQELKAAAPHMVELRPGQQFVDQLLVEGYGKSWAIFAKTTTPAALRLHLRKLLKVVDEAGRTLLFRFYDPRVLGAFLPTCDTSQIQTLFGPVDSFCFEKEFTQDFQSFRLNSAGNLDVTTTSVFRKDHCL